MVTLRLLSEDDKEQFILDNQEAFNYGALEEFGLRDSHFEEDGEIISRKTIEQSIEAGIAYRIFDDEKVVEYFNKYHPLPERYRFDNADEALEDNSLDGMLKFEKMVKQEEMKE